ncbi:MAG: hypothetical protein NTW16_14525 [Bacteroidetes bacterium]|nr:hypothetical protein [Bacteroidota bacterium]
MKEKKKNLEAEIKNFLEESTAENNALKRLIIALQEEETKMKSAKNNARESSQHHSI